MSKKKADKDNLQFRVSRTEERGAAIVAKLEKIADMNKPLSVNDVANLALSAGLNLVEQKLREIHQPTAKAA